MEPREETDEPVNLTNISENFTLDALNIWRTTIEDWITLGTVHIVHYENVLEDRMLEIRKIMDFLSIPIQDWRLPCVKYCNFDMYLREAFKTRLSRVKNENGNYPSN